MPPASHSVFDVRRFEHPLVAVDVIVLAIRDGQLATVCIQRKLPPFQGKWAIPGGFVRKEETLEAAALRELREETGIRVPSAYLEQLYTFGAVQRDPRGRVISVAYLVLTDDASVEPVGRTDAADARWWTVTDLPSLAFDHQRIIAYAVQRLRYKLEYTNVAYALLPKRFTLTELQQVYEAVFGKSLDRRNFRKKVVAIGFVRPTPERRAAGQGRPAQLWRSTKREPVSVKTFVARG